MFWVSKSKKILRKGIKFNQIKVRKREENLLGTHLGRAWRGAPHLRQRGWSGAAAVHPKRVSELWG